MPNFTLMMHRYSNLFLKQGKYKKSIDITNVKEYYLNSLAKFRIKQ